MRLGFGCALLSFNDEKDHIFFYEAWSTCFRKYFTCQPNMFQYIVYIYIYNIAATLSLSNIELVQYIDRLFQ